MASIDKRFWRVALDSVTAGEQTIRAAAAGQIHYVVGFLIVPEADGTMEFNSDTDAGGAGTETTLTGVLPLLEGQAIGFRGEKDCPPLATIAGQALVLETATADVSGFVYGFTEGP